ncbi:hypothetical protein LINPERHAP2_LOCUS4641 [Linum perenne]
MRMVELGNNTTKAESRYQTQSLDKDRDSSVQPKDAEFSKKDEIPMAKVPSLPDIENKGAAFLLKEGDQVFSRILLLICQWSDNQDPEQQNNNVESSTKNHEAESTQVAEQSSNQLSSIQNVSASPDFNENAESKALRITMRQRHKERAEA